MMQGRKNIKSYYWVL